MKSINRTSSSRILNLFILIIFFASFSLFAQNKPSNSENSKINEMTEKLNKKLILSDEQKNEVQNILKKYFDGLQNKSVNAEEAAKLKNDADKKIQNLFDNKQKMKFSIISDDWWALAKG
ncbi:MAG: hypothetical protein P8X73_17910 [Ignavibacteriaceae bacterium]|jgi:5S rRNA maturation endonuclease (ribonuclease M5)